MDGARRTSASFARFLERSFAILAAEHPEAYRAMCAALAPRVVSIRVGDEAVHLGFTPAAVRRLRWVAAPAVTIRATIPTVLAVIDAELSLLDAAMAGDLDAGGAPADLAAFHDGLVAYVHGAVRAPSFPFLLGEFRARHARRRRQQTRPPARAAHPGHLSTEEA